MYRKILIAIDGSRASRQALDEGLRLARENGADVCVAHVIDVVAPVGIGMTYVPAELLDSYRETARARLKEAQKQAMTAGLNCETDLLEIARLSDDVPHRLQECARCFGADLVVLGTHGRRGIARAILGSVAESFARLSTCPVLLVREAFEQEGVRDHA